MAALAFVTLILAITAGQSNGNWCVCKSGVGENMLQRALDYACGAGADCNPIHPNGQCYNPNTVKNHCDYAVNSYFQKKGQAQGSCDFAGTATVSASNPSSTGCVYPASASSTGTSATPSTGTGTTPSTGTSTTPSTGTSTTPSTGTSTTPSTGTSTTPSTGTSTIPSTTTPSTMNPSANTPSTTTPSSTSTTTTPYSTTPSTGVFGTGVGPSGAGINTDDSSGLRLVSTSLSLIWLVALVSLTLE